MTTANPTQGATKMTEIRDRRDRFDRRLLTLDNDTAAALRTWTNEHWTEIPGVGDGYSGVIGPYNPFFEVCEALWNASRTGGDRNPFIAGHEFGDEQEDGSRPTSYHLLVSTFGVEKVDGHGYRFRG